MKKKKLLKRLAEFLDRGTRKQLKRQAELEELLEKLAAKAVQIETKLGAERDEGKKKKMDKELRVVRAQHAKGAAALKSLQEKSAE